MKSSQRKTEQTVSARLLEEHLKFALPYEKNMDADIFVPYVLNPRVDDEVLQKYRKSDS